MEWKNQQHSAGLDIGQERLKFVELEKGRNGCPRLVNQGMLSFHDLGILEEGERYQEIERWAGEQHLKGKNICLGLPQYLTTPHVTDFPAGVQDDALDQMVGYEARQLAGISDDRFIWGYQPLRPAFSWKNPVMIGLCREKDIIDGRERLAAAGINVQDVGMTGLALANAFFFLHPEARKQTGMELLLDIGVENSTMVILAGGQALYVAGLMFGTERFIKALQDCRKCDHSQAERFLQDFTPVWGLAESPLTPAVNQLKTELEMNLEHWRSNGGIEEFNSMPVQALHLSGGCVKLPGLAEFLGRTYGCSADILEWRGEDGKTVLPQEMMIALGLALQGMGAADYAISLIPDLLRWQQRRVKNFRYLLVSVLAVALAAFLGMAGWWMYLRREKQALDDVTLRLNQCNSIIPRLDQAMEEIEFYQKMLIPIAEAGLRSDIFLETFNELNRVKPAQDWCIYVADEFSHRRAAEKDEAAAREKKPAGNRSNWGMQDLFQGREQSPDRRTIQVLDTELLSRMIVAGFTCPTSGGRYESILKIQNALNQGKYFAGVDWLDMNTEASGREDQVFRPWRIYLRDRQRQLRTDFTMFILKLPLKRKNVMLPERKKEGKK